MDKAGRDNRADQQNPNNPVSGEGRLEGYTGTGTKPDLDNNANQGNGANQGNDANQGNPNQAKSGPTARK